MNAELPAFLSWPEPWQSMTVRDVRENMGLPLLDEPPPWEAEGISRSTWFRRKRGRPKGEQPWIALGISKQAYYAKRKRERSG